MPLLERDVLPVLTKNCMGCHGGLKKEGELDLRTVDAMKRGGESGSALVAGKLDASLLWQRVADDEMPPGETKLSADDKAALCGWIEAGLPTLVERQKEIADPLLPAGKTHQPREVARAIDRHVQRGLDEAGLEPAEPCNDAEFLRRVHLDLTGRVPTAKQAVAFLDSTDPEKRAKLVEELLDSTEFGEHLGRTWRDWICPPELPSDMNSGKQPHREAREFGRWLGDRFAAGDTWDEIVRTVLTVDGEIKDQPQVIFFGLVGQGGKATPDGTTQAVGSLFMGVQLQCAQCHDDPYRTWSQREHWAMAAFFGETRGDFKKIEEESGDDRGRIKIPRSAFRNAGSTVPAAFLAGEEHQSLGPLRREFVEWLTARENPWFARSFANRVWFQLFARGVVNPVDDLRDLNPPSHPGLLKLLENEFAASGFDVRHLLRCVCNSATYQRTSRLPDGAEAGRVQALTTAFGRVPLRMMTADQLYDSLKLAYHDEKLDLRGIDPKDGNTNGESAPVGDAYLEFLRRFEIDEEDATNFVHGIPQMLTLLNHPRLLERSRDFDEVLRQDESPEATIRRLYLATLSRRPSAEELADALAYVNESDDPADALVGVLWSLVNRSEFFFVR